VLAALGRGACEAIEDAAALADAIATEPDVPAALAAYGARRAAAAAGEPRGGAVSRLYGGITI
jgi:anthraniloyl-CoA monooxygenase